jgi:hypothetical protein
METTNLSKSAMLTSGLSLLGGVVGIVYAVKNKSGFWGGLGWFLIGSIGGTAIGYLASSTMIDTQN